jgi:asparagine synthase (glutamine-hydrolysing)
MTGIFGWFTHSATQPAAERNTTGVAESLTGEFGQPCRSARGNGFGAIVCGNPGTSFIAECEERVVVATGHPRLAGASMDSMDETSFCRLMAEHVRNDADELLKRLRGDFAIAIIDTRMRRATIATDRMGIRPLFYGRQGDAVLFGSTIEALVFGLGAVPRVSPQQINDYLYFHMVPGPETIYEGIQRLLPAHALRAHNGSVSISPYWSAHFADHSNDSLPELTTQFKAVLRESVGRLLLERGLGTFLSGGTDSSTITGVACELAGRAVPAYSIGFDVEGYDEMAYARAAARHFGADHREHYVTHDDVLEAIPVIARTYDQPFGNASAMPTFFCAQAAARDGVQRLLAGDGGDELFGGNSRYAKQYVFELYATIPQAVRRGVIEPLLTRGAITKRVPGLKKLRSYVEQARIPMPDRTETYNMFHRLGADTLLERSFLVDVRQSHPLEMLRSAYSSIDADSLIDRMLALDWKFTLADNDLPKVTRMCDAAGVDCAFPLLDDEIVEFSLTLPPALKLKGTRLRYFFKEALRDFLPVETLTKQKHGFGLPFGPWLQRDGRLREFVFDHIRKLRTRAIVRGEFIDELLDVHLKHHASYFGAITWVLMMLELWFQRHEELERVVGRARLLDNRVEPRTRIGT